MASRRGHFVGVTQWPPVVKFSALLFSALLFSGLLYSASLFSASLFSALLFSALLFSGILTLGSSEEVARVGVGMEGSGLHELDQIAVQQCRTQLPHVTGRALAQLLSCFPRALALSDSTNVHNRTCTSLLLCTPA